jgi:transcription antitermination factor NusG
MSCGDTMNPGQFSWFAFHVRTKFEETVAITLSRKGFDAFLPTYKPRGGPIGHRHCEMPLFSNYVFCRVQAADLGSLLMIPGVMQIAGTAAGVKPVDDGEIAAIKQVVQAAPYYQPCPFHQVGRKVRVVGGELHNVEGILAESRHGNGIIVGISLLRLSVLVEIGDAARVVPVSNTRTGAVLGSLTESKQSNLWSALEQEVKRAIGMSPDQSGGLDQTIRFIPATVVFDSFCQAPLAGARGIPGPNRNLVLQTEDFDIHLQICREQEGRQILGQILPRGPKHFAKARLYLLWNGEKLQATTADTLGEFNFSEVPAGALNLQVELPYLTITGTLNC